jgi:hypothetical protein
MTSFPTHNFLLKSITPFLDLPDLINFATTNRSIHAKVEKEILDQKKQKIKGFLPLFHRPESRFVSQCFNLGYGESKHRNKIKFLLFHLPEVFSYIEEKKIDYLDLSLTTSYGGYSVDISHYIHDKSQIATIASQLLTYLKWNTTLTKCNLGLFETHLDRDILLYYTVYRHPKLDWVSLRANGASTRFSDPPHTIYLKPDRTGVWAHFRP